MVKIVFPMLAAALAAAGSASAGMPDCNDFPDFRARTSCYEAVSRALPANNPDLAGPAAAKPKTPVAAARRRGWRDRQEAR
jgi:hypothetical protein